MASFVVFNRGHVRRLQEALVFHADALIAGRPARDEAVSAVAADDVEQFESLADLAERLDRTLIRIAPSEQFVSALWQQLLEAEGDTAQTLWGRIRRLPPRTQLAAGIGGATLTAGVVILASRSFSDVLGNWRNRRTATA